MSYDLLFSVARIERLALGDYVNWDLKMTSAKERCLLYSVCYIKVLECPL